MSTDKTDMPRLSDKKVDAVTKGDRDVCHYDLAADLLDARRELEAEREAHAALRGREAEAAEALRRWGAWCWSPEGLGEPLYDAAVDGIPDPKPSTGGDL